MCGSSVPWEPWRSTRASTAAWWRSGSAGGFPSPTRPCAAGRPGSAPPPPPSPPSQPAPAGPPARRPGGPPGTGRRLGRLPWRTGGFVLSFGDRLIEVSPRSVALVDPATGRPDWRRLIGTGLHDAQVSDGRVFVVGADGPATARDRLWEVDARS